ncbi:MAG TPA: phage holin family protein [Alphaproteobacteria bacterium]|nr:phage holin family protein [Alphaproteobacteria bacterium]
MNEPSYHSEPSLAQLLSDLVTDAKQLLRQELALAKHEIRDEVRKTKAAVMSLGIGIGMAAIGGFLLTFMLVYGLNTLTGLPLWACYGIVGGMFVVIGVVLLYLGKNKMARIDVVPPLTVETMKENVRWIKEKATFEKT